MVQIPESCKCHECDVGWDGETEFVRLCPFHAAAPQMLDALEAVEFAGEYCTCPLCRGNSDDDHYLDCEIYLAIRAAKEE